MSFSHGGVPQTFKGFALAPEKHPIHVVTQVVLVSANSLAMGGKEASMLDIGWSIVKFTPQSHPTKQMRAVLSPSTFPSFTVDTLVLTLRIRDHPGCGTKGFPRGAVRAVG